MASPHGKMRRLLVARCIGKYMGEAAIVAEEQT